MKKTVMLTAKYPFGVGEDFIDAEFEALCKVYDISVYSTTLYDSAAKKTARYTPDFVKSELLFDKPFTAMNKLKYIFKVIVSLEYWAEIGMLIKNKKVKYTCIRELTAFCSRGRRIYDKLISLFGETIKNNPDDIVFYSFWLIDSAYAIARLRKKYGVRAISRAHGGDLYSERFPNNYNPMRKYVYDNLSAMYPISKMGRNYLIDDGANHETTKTAYLGTVDYGVRAAHRKTEEFVLLSCSYISPVKRIHLIAAALNNITDKKIKWLHFGDGEGKEEILKQTLNFSDNIKVCFMGNTPHETLMDYYASNDIDLFINVSQSEGIPVSIMEAISFGIPVLATDVGGSGEIAIDNITGKLVKIDITTKELAEEIKAFVGMPREKYYFLRKSTRAYWEERFNAKINYNSFYEELISD